MKKMAHIKCYNLNNLHYERLENNGILVLVKHVLVKYFSFVEIK